MPGVTIAAYIPRKRFTPNPGGVLRGVERGLRDFSYMTVNKMQDYPPARPWKHRPPSRGVRKGGRRTGYYGRMWSANITFTWGSVRIENRTLYALFVGGPYPGGGRGKRQALALRARGWPSVSDVAPKLAAQWRPVMIRRILGDVS